MKLRDALELLREMNANSNGTFCLTANARICGDGVIRQTWEVRNIKDDNDYGELIATGVSPVMAIIKAYNKIMTANK